MSDYAASWSKAKKAFEQETGISKPSEKGKLLFIEWRKGSHIEDWLEKLDKLAGSKGIEFLSSKKLVEADSDAKSLKKAGDAYMNLLDAAINKEKADKANSTSYRALKVLRAELNNVTTSVTHAVNRCRLQNDQDVKTYEGKAQQTLLTLKSLSTGLQSACASATTRAQKVLQDPTWDNFTDMFPAAARGVTQQMANVMKFAFPDDLDPNGRMAPALKEVLDLEPRLYWMMIDMSKAVASAKQIVLKYNTASGSTPLDANLLRMANNPPRLPANADANMVKQAVKHFLDEIKELKPVTKLLADAKL